MSEYLIYCKTLNSQRFRAIGTDSKHERLFPVANLINACIWNNKGERDIMLSELTAANSQLQFKGVQR